MIIRRTGPRHYIVKMEDLDKVPKKAHTVVEDFQPCEADNAVVAVKEGKIIAFFRYCAYSHGLYACGTWVQKKYRRRGIAKKLWKYALKVEKCDYVEVTTITKAGTALVRHLARKEKKVDFELDARM